MNEIDNIISKYSYLKFEFTKNMPEGLHGYNVGNKILIDSTIPENLQYQYMCEEIAHNKLSVGDICNYSDEKSKIQELKARKLGIKIAITKEKLKKTIKKYDSDYEIAEELDIRLDYLHKLGKIYGYHYKQIY